jgi:hypothetical protein
MRILASATLALLSVTLLVGCNGSTSTDSWSALGIDSHGRVLPAVALAAHTAISTLGRLRLSAAAIA